jgi:hypothetical protein
MSKKQEGTYEGKSMKKEPKFCQMVVFIGIKKGPISG